MRRAIVGLLLSLLLTAALLLAAGAARPPVWAVEAVDFALAEGVLEREEDLRPQEPVTRAELAGMLVRLLRVQDRADLSGYTDVLPADADAMAGAAALGLFQGSGGKLQPQKTLTREEAFQVLARAFGVTAGNGYGLAKFQDAAQVHDWALEAVDAMICAGHIQGAGGQLRPQALMTQQELLQMLYQMTGGVVRDENVPEQGSVLLLAGGSVDGAHIGGDLVVGCDFEETVTLSNVEVEGRIVLCGGSVRIKDASARSGVYCTGRNVTLETDGTMAVTVTGGGAAIAGGGRVDALADVTLRQGTYTVTAANGAAVTLEESARAGSATLLGRGSAVRGDGAVSEAVIHGRDCAVTAPADQVTELSDPGIAGVQITAVKAANDPTPQAPAITTTVRFDHVDTSNYSNATDGVRVCTLSWYVDGAAVQKDLHFSLYEGATASLTTAGVYTGALKPTRTILVRLSYGEETVELTQTVNQHLEQLPTQVRTLEVEATVRRNTSLYSGVGYGWMANIPAGTYATYINYSGTSYGKIRLADGREGWVRWSDLTISNKDYVRDTDYTQRDKENFVNTRGYTSTTGKLVWINLLTQRVNVFEGAAGSWKLIRTCPCCSGKNTTPTIGGVFKYQYRQDAWDFGSYYVRRPMIFNGGHAFHSRTYVKSTGGLLDATMGRPASHGCVRMYDADVDWLWNNMPYGTTVVVY